MRYSYLHVCKGKGKAVPLQAWSGPEGSRNFKVCHPRCVCVTRWEGGGSSIQHN